MPDLNQLFDSIEEARNFTPADRAKIMNYAYSAAKASGQFDRSQLRDIRNDTYKMVADRSARTTPEDIAMQSWGGGDIFARGDLPDYSDILQKQAQFNNRETLDDAVAMIGNPKSWVAGIKPVSDLVSMGVSLVKTTIPTSVSAVLGIDNKGFEQNLKEIQSTTPFKRIKDWYGEFAKDDPKLYELFSAAQVDFAMGGVLGGARSAAMEGLNWFDRLRVAMAPAVSSVVSGQVAYKTIDATAEALQDTDLSPTAKLGVSLMASIVGAMGADMVFGQIIERIIKGGASEAALATKVGDMATAAGLKGVDQSSLSEFAKFLLNNPEASEDLVEAIKKFTGLTDVSAETIPNTLNATAEAMAKFQSGLPLTEAESKLIQALRPEVGVPQSVLDNYKNEQALKGKALPEGEGQFVLEPAEQLQALPTGEAKAQLPKGAPYKTMETKTIGFAPDGKLIVSKSYVANKYPAFSHLMRNLPTTDLDSAVYSANDVFDTIKGLVVRSGPGMDAAGWNLQKPTLMEGFNLWDEIRGGLQKEKGLALDELLKDMPNGAEVARVIKDAFPGLDIAYRVGDLPDKVVGASNAIQKIITVGDSKVAIGDLAHEIGHMHFWHGIDADTKMVFLEHMREVALDEVRWGMSYPDYFKALRNLDKLSPTDQQRALAILNNPSEMYAQQFKSYMMDNVIPHADTAKTYQSAFAGIRKLFRTAFSNWNKIPQETRDFLVKTIYSPDPMDISAVPSSVLLERVESNKFITGGVDYDLNKINTIRENFKLAYGRPLEAIPIEELNVFDLTDAVDLQALSFLHGLEEANYAYLQRAMDRLGELLAPENRANLLRQLSGSLSDIPEAVAKDNQMKFLRDLRRRQLSAMELLSRNDEAVNDIKIRDLVRNDPHPFGEDEAVQLQMRISELDLKREELTSALPDILGGRGLIDVIDPSFTTKLEEAEYLMNIFNGNTKMTPIVAANAFRIIAAGMLGLEHDPNATFDFPFFGRVTWSPSRFLSWGPGVAFLVPGMPSLGLKAVREAKNLGKVGLAKLRAKATSDPLFDKISGIVDKQIERTKLTMEYVGGYGKEIANAKREAYVHATNKIKDFYLLRDAMLARFTPEERDAITKIYTKEPTFVNKAQHYLNNPDIQLSLALVENVYKGLEKIFTDIGLGSPKFKDLDRYINRVYDKPRPEDPSAIVRISNIKGIKAPFLRHRGVEGTISNSPTVSKGGARGALDIFMESVGQSGKNVDEVKRINCYLDANGDKVWVVPGTQKEKDLLSAGYKRFMVWDDNTGYTGYQLLGIHKNGEIKVSHDYTPAQRQAMGENFDIAMRLGAMGDMLEHDLRRGSLYHMISKNPELAQLITDPIKKQEMIDTFSWKVIPDEVVKETGMKRYGSLSGMVVSPKTMRLINSMERPIFQSLTSKFSKFDPASGVFKAYSKLLNAWKMGKTVLSPAGHLNNFIGNAMMGTLKGHNIFSELANSNKLGDIHNLTRQYTKALQSGDLNKAKELMAKAQQSKDYQYYLEAKQLGMFDSTYVSAEMRHKNVIEKIKANRAAAQQGAQPQSKVEQLYSTVKGYLEKAKDGITNLYEQGDLKYKMGAYYNARTKLKMNPRDAIDYAYEAYFDYNNLSPLAQSLKDYGVAPFISYMYNSLPAFGKALMEHPERAAAVVVLLEGMNYLGVASVFGASDVQKKKEALDKIMPDWYKIRGGAGLFRTALVNPITSDMNLTNEKGRAVPRVNMLSIRNVMPVGELLETSGGGRGNLADSVPLNFLYKALCGNPLIAAIVSWGTGKELYTGRSFTEGSPLRTDANQERYFNNYMKYLWGQAMPTIAPYAPAWNRIGEGLAGAGVLSSYDDKSGLDRQGVPLSLGRAVAATFGVRDNNFYLNSVKRRIEGNKGDISRAKGVLTVMRKDPSNTREAIAERKAEIRQAQREQRQRARETREALRYLIQEGQKESGGQVLPH